MNHRRVRDRHRRRRVLRCERWTQRMNGTCRGRRRLHRGFFGRFGRGFRTGRLRAGDGLRAHRLGRFDVIVFRLARLRNFGVFTAGGVCRAVFAGQAAAEFQRDIVVERTRMRFLVRDSELG